MLAESALNNSLTSRDTGRVYDRALNNMLQEHLLELFRGQAGHGIGDGFKGLVRRDEDGDIWLRIDGFDQTRAGESTHDAGKPCSSSGGGCVGGDGENGIDLVNCCSSNDDILTFVSTSEGGEIRLMSLQNGLTAWVTVDVARFPERRMTLEPLSWAPRF